MHQFIFMVWTWLTIVLEIIGRNYYYLSYYGHSVK